MRTHGTTLECFEDLMQRIQPDLYEKRKLLAEVLGVEDATVRRWATGPSVPVGMSLLSLRYYLDYLGYRVDELTTIPNTLQDAGKLLAFRVIALEDMAKLTHFDGYPDMLIAVLRGARGISAEREEHIREVVHAYQRELAEKLLTIPKVVLLGHAPIAEGIFSTAPKVPAIARAAIVPQSKPKADNRREERFKGLALNLLDFARFYTNPAVPEEVRDQLREVVGQENIFELKNLLARLCGSKAFSNQQ